MRERESGGGKERDREKRMRERERDNVANELNRQKVLNNRQINYVIIFI